MSEILKIVAIGPESTGKSTLCQQLAQHYNTLWCPEYAREYLLANGFNYTYDDLLAIAKGQLALEEEYEFKVNSGELKASKSVIAYLQSPILFVDTDMYIMKVWCEYVFHKCHPFILEQIAKRRYDLYLLCNADLPWEPDVLREYPDEASRIELYGIYKKLLLNQPVPFIEITGSYNQRLQTAIAAVNALFFKASP